MYCGLQLIREVWAALIYVCSHCSRTHSPASPLVTVVHCIWCEHRYFLVLSLVYLVKKGVWCLLVYTFSPHFTVHMFGDFMEQGICMVWLAGSEDTECRVAIHTFPNEVWIHRGMQTWRGNVSIFRGKVREERGEQQINSKWTMILSILETLSLNMSKSLVLQQWPPSAGARGVALWPQTDRPLLRKD